MLEVLTPQQRRVADLRLIGPTILTLDQTSEKMNGITHEAVRLLQKYALKKMIKIFAYEYGNQFPETEVLTFPLTILNLSPRLAGCLKRIRSIGELISMSADELLSIRNFGKIYLEEVRKKLAEKDLRLRGDVRRLTVDEGEENHSETCVEGEVKPEA
jgi:DNA-directed RNA polymerase alpha subunit